MASVEDVLASMAEPNREEEELCFVIDKDFRLISVPERGTVLGVEGDKDVNLVRFRMPRYYRGTDLSDFAIEVHYDNAEGERGIAPTSDKTVSEDAIRFTWVVGKDVVSSKGTVRFTVYCVKKDADGTIEQAFGTTIGTGTSLEGLGGDEN